MFDPLVFQKERKRVILESLCMCISKDRKPIVDFRPVNDWRAHSNVHHYEQFNHSRIVVCPLFLYLWLRLIFSMY